MKRQANLVHHGDARELPGLLGAGRATLVYMDPPFAVGARFGARTRPREHRARGPIAYVDAWPSLVAYLAWLEERLAAARELLTPDGSAWLHLDHRAVHDAKIVCDRVFGARRFAGEIVWVPGNGARARKGIGVTHQTILVYARGPTPVWNARDPALRRPFARTSLAMHFRNVDPDGRAFRERTIGGKTYRYYADEGRAIGSVWDDCPAMVANTPLRKETTGYPTQKPRALLDRIVRGASRTGDLVVDPFFGSGTTLESAGLLGRAFAGADVGALAVRTATARLAAAGLAFRVSPSAP